MPHEPLFPVRGRRVRIAAVAAIVVAVLVVAVRGRGSGPISLATAVKPATNGSFYHWRDVEIAGSVGFMRAEGWCALRRSRTLDLSGAARVVEERRSPSGLYRRTRNGRTSFESRSDLVGMEEGDDFLTKAVARLTAPGTRLTPFGDSRWRGGAATYTLEPRTDRILRIEAPGEQILIDYPPALSSDLFEAPR